MNGLAYLVSAFVLGGLHALEPGHGKTVVAAYLVGSKGRVRDAVLLGGVVTFTHTFSIILLALLTAVAAAYLVPETVQEVLEVVSGLLVVGVGVWMIRDRIILKRSVHGHSHVVGGHNSHGGNGHIHGAHSHGREGHAGIVESHGERELVASAVGHDHPHPHPQKHGFDDHAHEGDSRNPGARDHPHLHPHDDGAHDHHSRSHTLPPGERVSLGGLITLGISGGIVPCPAALALLLAAVAVGNIVGGLSLVIVFSLGLAAVLIAIGVALVKAADVASRYLGDGLVGEGRLSRYAGYASALVVTALGIGMTARAALDVIGTRLFP